LKMGAGGDTIYDVDLASDLKARFSGGTTDVRFANDSDRTKVMNADDDDILRIGLTINSPITIVSVDKVDADFFRAHLFAVGEHRGDSG
jgi:hypothetical protein